MPLVNFLLGGSVDFSNKFLVLSMPAGYNGPMTYADLTKAGANVFAWGNFVTIIINFVLLAFVIFWMVKAIYKARAKSEEVPAAPAATPEDVALLREIRDLLKKPDPKPDPRRRGSGSALNGSRAVAADVPAGATPACAERSASLFYCAAICRSTRRANMAKLARTMLGEQEIVRFGGQRIIHRFHLPVSGGRQKLVAGRALDQHGR